MVTREPFVHQGRIPTLLRENRLAHDLGLPALSATQDRFMLCGSPQMLADTRAELDKLGLAEGSMNRPGGYVVERAFVER